MKELFTITIPIVAGFVGTIISIFITYYYSKKRETEKEIREIKYKAYIDYINIDLKYANASKKDQKIMDNEYFGITGQLCLYASRHVLECYSNYIKVAHEPQSGWKRQYAELILAMRNDIGVKILDSINNKDVRKAFELD